MSANVPWGLIRKSGDKNSANKELVVVSFTMFFVSKKVREKYGVLPN